MANSVSDTSTVRALAASPEKLFFLYILAYALLYSLLPSVWYQSVLPDSAQNITWGHVWSWSYNRHPPMGTWFITLVGYFCKNNEVATFTASILCLSISLIFIFRLTKAYLPVKDAVSACIISTLSLYFLTNFVLQFNQNTIMLPFWVLVCYYTDRCLRDNQWSDWLLLSGVSAGALLAKYESLIIIFLALGYILFHYKKTYVTKLITAACFTLLLLSPHLLSVINHDFLTLQYINTRVIAHQYHPIYFPRFYFFIKALVTLSSHLLPSLALLFLLYKKKVLVGEPHGKYKFNFLIYLGIAPFILVSLLALLLKIKIQAEWGYPLFIFTIPALFFYYKVSVNHATLSKLSIFALALHALSLTAYFLIHYYTPRQFRTSYPSYALAREAEQYWYQFTSKPIRFVGGDELLYYYLGAYLSSKPLLLEHYSLQESPWVREQELKEDGLLLVLNGCNKRRSEQIKAQFTARAYQCLTVPMSNKYKPKSIAMTFIVVPPA